MSLKGIDRPLDSSSCIGLLGGGQLGMYFTRSARKLGYRVCCFTQNERDPAAQIADATVIGDFRDKDLVHEFIAQVQTVTYEFENIPEETLAAIDGERTLFPPLDLIHATQNRAREKSMLRELRIPTAQFYLIQTQQELIDAVEAMPGGSILKTASEGYDGKGQWAIDDETDLTAVWQKTGGAACTLEAKIDLAAEYSLLVAGDISGDRAYVGPFCNQHANHILDVSWLDGSFSGEQLDLMHRIADKLADRFQLVGLICIEFFLSRAGELLVNEIAPRPHNSGHLTIDAFSQSQFDLQALAVSGNALVQPQQTRAAAMVNLLGDRWLDADEDALINRFPLEVPLAENVGDAHVRLHLYGKSQPRPGRKMGHVTVLGEQQAEVIARAKDFREQLGQHHASISN